VRRLLLVALIAGVTFSGISAARATSLYEPTIDASTNKTVLFIGDSNIMFGAAAITTALVNRPHGYLPVFTPRGGIGIRGYKQGFCPAATVAPCDAPDYWQTRLPEVLAVVHPDAIVVNLGINDAKAPGTDTSAGYSDYSEKMAWLLALLPADVPVFWSGLPTPIEPKSFQVGSSAIDRAITNQPGIHVLRWYVAAYQHPEYMIQPHVNEHYSVAGNNAYAAMVVAALDQQFGQ